MQTLCKNYGEDIDKSEILGYQMKKMNQIINAMEDAMDGMEAGNLRVTTQKIEESLGNDMGIKMIKIVLKLGAVIQISYSIFIWILHVMYIAKGHPKNDFEKIWSIINIVIPCIWICCLLCCCSLAKLITIFINRFKKW